MGLGGRSSPLRGMLNSPWLSDICSLRLIDGLRASLIRALNRLIPRLPSVDYSRVRRSILILNLSPHESIRGCDGPLVTAVDSSGVSVHKCGGWVERVYGRKKRHVKIDFAVDVRTKEFIAMDVTTELMVGMTLRFRRA